MKMNITAGILGVAIALNANGGVKQFEGRWECFDPNDGGVGFARIARDKGELRKAGSDSWHGPCGYGWPAITYTSPLHYVNGKLYGTWYLDCQAPPTAEDGDREFDVVYSLRKLGKQTELVESLFKHDGDDFILVRRPITCGKIR